MIRVALRQAGSKIYPGLPDSPGTLPRLAASRDAGGFFFMSVPMHSWDDRRHG
jgi:hypothetical protein